ncbi:MAG TPA: hypothetical protein DCY79_04805 [Planctomycetaceae bacterium]|nr:hypothetical protein [Blastopirellula sp.]HAY79108.1 hypothetical protein [Planctomycetaceae bacterium]
MIWHVGELAIYPDGQSITSAETRGNKSLNDRLNISSRTSLMSCLGWQCLNAFAREPSHTAMQTICLVMLRSASIELLHATGEMWCVQGIA